MHYKIITLLSGYSLDDKTRWKRERRCGLSTKEGTPLVAKGEGQGTEIQLSGTSTQPAPDI